MVVDGLDVDYRLQRELAAIDPLGPGAPRALIGIAGLTVGRARLAAGGHTQLTLRKGREVLDGIAFDRPDLADIAPDTAVDLAGYLESRTFGGLRIAPDRGRRRGPGRPPRRRSGRSRRVAG